MKNSYYAYKLEIAWKTFLETFFFSENTCGCVLGPWPREGLSSERLSLALEFFVSLALASSHVSSTPPLLSTVTMYQDFLSN